MKNIIYTSLFFLFVFQVSFGQIAFENNYVSNFNKRSYNPFGSYEVFVDFDDDGDLDLVTTFYNGVIGWHENLDGLGSYAQQQVLLNFNETGNFAFEAKDFDDDSDTDIIRIREGVLLWYQQQDGAYLIGNGIPLIEDYDIKYFATADLDNDYDLDIIFSNSLDNNNTLYWVENLNGFSTFSEPVVIDSTTGFGRFNFLVDDIDNDGDNDILGSEEQLILYENSDGNGDFSNHHIIQDDITISFSLTPYDDTVIVDYDDDGDKDIVANIYSDYMKIFSYDTDISTWYSQSLSLFHSNSGFCLFDVDNDNDLDIVRGNPNGIYASYNDNNSFSFETQVIGDGSYKVRSLMDIDLDGDLDFFAQKYSDLMFKINDNGVFEKQLPVVMTLSTPKELVAADIDGDNNLDIVTSDWYGKIFWFSRQNNSDLFSVQKYLHDNDNFGENQERTLKASDLDGDNDVDIVSISRVTGKIYWHENADGLGGFEAQELIDDGFSNSNPLYSVDISDVDNDGDNDIIVGAGHDIIWYQNVNGNASVWQEVEIISFEASAVEMELVDLDNDLDDDIVLLNWDTIEWVENVGGMFSTVEPLSPLIFNNDCKFKVDDINNDNLKDIIVSNTSDNTITILGQLDDTFEFEELAVIGEATNVTSIDVADIDNDGDNDIVASLESLDVGVWYENLDGQGILFSDINIIAVNVADAPYISVADIDLDGDQDVLQVSSSYGELIWSENLSYSNRISGFVSITLDTNSDGCDIYENQPVPNVMITTTNGTEDLATFSLNNGQYQLFPTQEGNFQTQISSPLPTYFESNPSTGSSEFNGQNNIDNIDFCIEPIGVFYDLEISAYAIDDARPGFSETTYEIVYKNVGTVPIDVGYVSFEYDNLRMEFDSTSGVLYNQTDNSVIIEYENLQPFEIRTFTIDFNINFSPAVVLGDVLLFEAEITPNSQDQTTDNNVFSFQQVVIGSFDPNDITCLEGSQILLEDADKYLHYLIRFQNTGTASAINVRVENMLDDKFDWTTMQLESLSHNGRVEIVNGSEVSFIFDNINLPDSTNDEPNSHGYIAYKIKPKEDVVIGDIFYNTADIYFDFNPPIVTNTATTEIVEEFLSVSEFEDNTFTVFPNPTNSKLTIQSKVDIHDISIVDINGRLLNSIDVIDKNKEYIIDVENLSDGIYFLSIQAEIDEQVIRFVKN